MKLIKIIQEGLASKHNKRIIQSLKCPRCNCIFQYRLNKNDFSERDFSFGNIFIYCPQCGREIQMFLDRFINNEYDCNI